MVENCVFCGIAEGKIPSTTVYEDDRYVAFLDIAPATHGHVLIIPREHFEDVHKIDDDVLAGLTLLGKRIATALKEIFGGGVRLEQNNGSEVGQSVFHYHMHVIPHYDGDGYQPKVGFNWWTGLKYGDNEEMNSYASKIKANLS